MMTISEALALAIDHHRAGRLREAEAVYRRILEVAAALAGLVAAR